MPLRFRPPLTQHEQKILLSLPRTRTGFVIHPDYLPHDQREPYVRELGAWCRANPRQDWPQWLADFVDRRRAELAQRTKPAGVGAGDDAAAVPGLAAGEV